MVKASHATDIPSVKKVITVKTYQTHVRGNTKNAKDVCTLINVNLDYNVFAEDVYPKNWKVSIAKSQRNVQREQYAAMKHVARHFKSTRNARTTKNVVEKVLPVTGFHVSWQANLENDVATLNLATKI